MNHRPLAFAVVSAMFFAASATASAQTASSPTLDGKAAFDKLKGLGGTWSGPIGTADGPRGKVTYEVISGGSVVMEVLFPGEPHEMRSMYHLDRDELIMTHYCSGGTQPRMRFSKTASMPSKLVFDFDGGTNFDPKTGSYIHDGEIRFLPDGRLEASWNFFANGKSAGANHFLALSKEK